jgi:hypothetical protein
MVARVATFHTLDPDRLDQAAVARLRKIVRETPGFVAGYHLSAPRSARALSILILESPEVGRDIAEALDARPTGDRVGIDPDTVEFFSVEAF